MKDPLLLFWTALIFGSLAWYFLLLFYVGVRGGKEIRRLTRRLGERPPLGGPGAGTSARGEGEARTPGLG
ncbi:MAG: hypothetical protein FJ387_11025 [Verrucomicrobia bacterium]|nr:hypothetical protein [Verrucomicrobiota bacterium]